MHLVVLKIVRTDSMECDKDLTNARIQELLNEVKAFEDELTPYRENPNTSTMWAILAIRKAKLTSLLGSRYEQNKSKKSRRGRKAG